MVASEKNGLSSNISMLDPFLVFTQPLRPSIGSLSIIHIEDGLRISGTPSLQPQQPTLLQRKNIRPRVKGTRPVPIEHSPGSIGPHLEVPDVQILLPAFNKPTHWTFKRTRIQYTNFPVATNTTPFRDGKYSPIGIQHLKNSPK